MAKKKTKKVLTIGWRLVLVIQIIASALLFFSILKLGAFPFIHLLFLFILLAGLCVLFAFLMKPRGRHYITNLVIKIISIVLSIILLIGTLYIAKGNTVLLNIAGANKQITRYVVLVLEESDAKEIVDLNIETIETCIMNDRPSSVSKVTEAFTLEFGIDVEYVLDYETLGSHLYDQTKDAILMNSALMGVLENKYPEFKKDTRVIWEYDVIEEVPDFSKDANVTNETFTIYVSGIDTTGSIASVSRSDVNMLVTVNPISKQILLTSIPRDYFVEMADSGIKDKLTHAGLKGVENSQQTIENFLDIEINYYAKVNFTSLETIVDALGGITIDSPYAFRADADHSVYIYEGINELNGREALAFVRERYALPNGDNDRIKNQQLVLKALLEKAMSSSIITNYSDVLESIQGAFETNMESKEIMALIRMQLKDMSSWTFTSQQLTGHGEILTGGAYAPNQALWYMVPDQESIDECGSLIKQMTYR